MAMLVKDATARKIQDLLFKAGGRGVQRPLDPRDLGGGATADFLYKRFRVDYVDTETMLCNAGIYTLNGTIIESIADQSIVGPGNSADGFTAPFVAPTTYFVWIQKHQDPGGYRDATISPDDIRVYCDDAFPPESALMRQQYWLLASFDVIDSDGSPVIDESTLIRYWIGDIDEITIVPDGSLDPKPQIDIRTLKFLIDNGGIGQLEMYNADLTTLAGNQAWASKDGLPVLGKDTNGNGIMRWIGTDYQASLIGQKSIVIKAGADFEHIQLNGIDESSYSDSGYQDLCFRNQPGTFGGWETHFINSSYLTVGEADHAASADSLSTPQSHHMLDSVSGIGGGDFYDGGGANNDDHDLRYIRLSATHLDLSGWFTDGLFTGGNVIEINQGDLLTTDKILVRRV